LRALEGNAELEKLRPVDMDRSMDHTATSGLGKTADSNRTPEVHNRAVDHIHSLDSRIQTMLERERTDNMRWPKWSNRSAQQTPESGF
jgi:hypothetical protein